MTKLTLDLTELRKVRDNSSFFDSIWVLFASKINWESSFELSVIADTL